MILRILSDMNKITRTLFKLIPLALVAMVGFVSTGHAEGRDFVAANITVDLSRGGEVSEDSSFTNPSDIKDKTFINLDLKIIVDASSASSIKRIVDQGISSEDAGCLPGLYNAMDMEDGLRYFFVTSPIDKNGNAVTVQATIYPGERSNNPYNDVFCEYDPKLSEKKAVFRIRGFFFIRHSQILNGIDVQLRPVQLTAAETSKIF